MEGAALLRLTGHSVIPVCMLTGFLFARPIAGYAQTDSSSSKSPEAGSSVPVQPQKREARELFHQYCTKCHGADGTGGPGRRSAPRIPDFTLASWQAKQTEAQLLGSILNGKGTQMPPWRGKISKEQGQSLTTYIRAFAPSPGESPQRSLEEAARFDERYCRLVEQLNELRRQFRQLSGNSSSVEPSKHAPSERPMPRQHKVGLSSPPAAAGAAAVRDLYRKRCARCHGADGTGAMSRGRLSEIPDFTAASWQAQRSDTQMVKSILDGKGTEMPPQQGKITEEQAKRLVAYIRSFAPSTKKPPRQEERQVPQPTLSSGLQQPDVPTSGEGREAEPVAGFSEKLLEWLGRFHPPSVHFPVALLTAAAVAELLGMATGKRSFDAVTRYCVWFGALTAVVAGVLGWLRGGLSLTDASWILMTHRWLGTSTVACAVLVLGLSEMSRRLRRNRLGFRIVLFAGAILVLVTGFFGGAVVNGLDHYAWPQ
jgi:mono/diheme cytochrome c family protein/uncharacterized membrane protein